MKISQSVECSTRGPARDGRLPSLAALAAVTAVASVAPPPLAAERVTFATLNIAYATHASLEQIAAAIRALDADVVALQEVDRFTRRSPTDQAAQLGRLLDMEVAYAPAIDYQGGEFGIALLSRVAIVAIVAMESIRLPILDYHSLPPPTRLLFGCRQDDIEQHLLLTARLRLADDTEISVATTHLGRCGATERLPQAAAIATHAVSTALLAGDFNARRSGRVAGHLTSNGWRVLVARGVDWIVGRSCIAVEEVVPEPARVSDHPLVAARVRVQPACVVD